jgi:hypothetical protein
MLHEEQQTISMEINVEEWTHVLLQNTQYSHLHSFHATGKSSGLAAKMTLAQLSQGRYEGYIIHAVGPDSGFILCAAVREC